MAQNSNQKVPTQAAVRTYVGSLTGVSGNWTVGGNLTVNGATTTIDTATLSVEDKNIGIGSVTTPTNGVGTGGGLTLFGGADGDKSLTWNSSAQNHYWQQVVVNYSLMRVLTPAKCSRKKLIFLQLH